MVRLADKSILVVKTDAVLAADLNDVILNLSANGNFAGCILNDVWPEFSVLGSTGADESGYYGRYSYGYGYGGYRKYNKYTQYARYGSKYAQSTISDELMSSESDEADVSHTTNKETVNK